MLWWEGGDPSTSLGMTAGLPLGMTGVAALEYTEKEMDSVCSVFHRRGRQG
jgi:hypothetical protein